MGTNGCSHSLYGWAAWFDQGTSCFERALDGLDQADCIHLVSRFIDRTSLVRMAHSICTPCLCKWFCYRQTNDEGCPSRKSNGSDFPVVVSPFSHRIGCRSSSVHGVSPLDVLIGEATTEATLWWSYIGALFTLFIIDLAWRFRFIHGGADAKALMWVTLLFPSWTAVPVYSDASMERLYASPSITEPLIWGGFLFVLIPFVLLLRNIATGSVGLSRTSSWLGCLFQYR